MKSKKHLSFGSLRDGLSKQFLKMEDSRQSTKVSYPLHDTMLSGFACMFFQDPSLLAFQQRFADETEVSNLHHLFGVTEIPSDSQMREIIDQVAPTSYGGIFKEYFKRLQRAKYLESYEFLDQLYLCSIDGVQYFSSSTVHCSQCLESHHNNGKVTYSHKVLQAAIMHPDCKQVLPLAPEEISNTDGGTKQDCEINAAKRLLPNLRLDHPKLGLLIVGDGLFSKQPMILATLEQKMHYLYVAKPKDHTYMMEWIAAYDPQEIPTFEWQDQKGRLHQYQWLNQIPLKGSKDSIKVNYLHYQIVTTDSKGQTKTHYKNSWVTDLEITETNVILLAKAGRCRWKIENECFNTLKNQGYHINHNYGHGQKHLCFNFYILTLLAFFFHQIFELSDRLYQEARTKFFTKRKLWEALRTLIQFVLFESWEQLLQIALKKTTPHLIPVPP